MENKKLAVIETSSHQKQFILSNSIHPLLVGGLGSGKTFAGIMRCIHLIYVNRDTKKITGKPYVYGIYMPNYSFFKSQIIPQFELFFEATGITDYVINKTDYTIVIDDYAIIRMKSLENPTKIVGYEVHDSWIDELDIMQTEKAGESFDKVNQRNRADKINGQANTLCVTSTPDGGTEGFLYKQWIKEPKKSEDLKKLYEVIRGATINNTRLKEAYLMQAFGNMTYEKYRQMGLGEFVDVSAHPVYSRFNKFTSNTPKLWEGETLHIGMDFNVTKMAAVACILDENGSLYVVDEIHSTLQTGEPIIDVISMIPEIKLRYPNIRIIIYPDASGNNREAGDAGNTKVSRLKEHFEVRLNYKRSESKPTNPSIDDSVSVLNQSFGNRLYVNVEECPKLVNNLLMQQYVKKDGRFLPSKTRDVDHMIDALRYVTYYLFKKGSGGGRDLSKLNRKL